MALREISTTANIALVSILTLSLGKFLGVREKRALVVDAEGIRVKVLIGITGRMVKRGLKLDTSAIAKPCDLAVPGAFSPPIGGSLA